MIQTIRPTWGEVPGGVYMADEWNKPQPQSRESSEEESKPNAAPEQDRKKESSDDLFYWLNALTTALVCLVLVFTFLGRLTRVDGHSMENTLQDGQLLLVWSLGYTPRQGDIVVLNKTTVEHLHGVAIVKRVIATGGQTVEIDYNTNAVYVDGIQLDEFYIKEPMMDMSHDPLYSQLHFEVPKGSIFVMGDNRNGSDDSRDSRIGVIDEDYVLGKAVFSVFPFDTVGPM